MRSFLFFSLLLIIAISINLYKNFHPNLEGDAVSMILMAQAPLSDMGVPYRDFWEYKPPGVFLLLAPWLKVFGFSMLSLRILQLFFLVGTGLLTYLIFRKILPLVYSLVAGSLAILIFYSPYFFRNFLPAELFGLFFSLAGLVSLIYLKKGKWRFFGASFLFGLSGQMKDPFGLTILSVVPWLVYFLISRDFKSFRRACIFTLTGLAVSLLVVLTYLLITGSMDAYFEVLDVKSRIFGISLLLSPGAALIRFMNVFWHAKNIILLFQYPTAPILALWFFAFLFALIIKKKLRFPLKSIKNHYPEVIPTIGIAFSSRTVGILTVVFYSLSSFLGFALVDKFDFHYMLQIVFPLFFFLSILWKSILDNIGIILRKEALTLLLFPVFVLSLFPKGPYLKSYNLDDYNLLNILGQLQKNIAAPEPPKKIEDYIQSETESTSCILSVYGWSVGETYFKARRRPCTRFFLANIVVENWQKKEYHQSVLKTPPEAIVYFASEGSDMDVARFEQEVINLRKIIDNCYQLNSQFPTYHLYFPRYQGEQLKICVEGNS